MPMIINLKSEGWHMFVFALDTVIENSFFGISVLEYFTLVCLKNVNISEFTEWFLSTVSENIIRKHIVIDY